MNYLLDTNIILTYLRKSKLANKIDQEYNPLGEDNTAIISVVSIGEIKSLALQNNWGAQKQQTLLELLNVFLIADINVNSIINRYAEIDAFSQGRLKNKALKMTSRNMGKNDLWIAATASILEVKLLTTDKDFSHLSHEFIELGLIEP